MVSDAKKIQVFINITVAETIRLKAVAMRLRQLRSTFNAARISVDGTPLEGKMFDLSHWVDVVDTAARAAVPNSLASAATSDKDTYGII